MQIQVLEAEACCPVKQQGDDCDWGSVTKRSRGRVRIEMKKGSQAVPHARWLRVSRLQTWKKAASKKWQQKVGTSLAKTGDPGLIPPTSQGGTSWLCPMRQSACPYHTDLLPVYSFQSQWFWHLTNAGAVPEIQAKCYGH